MSIFNREPKRNSDFNSLNPDFRRKLLLVFGDMIEDGYAPIIVEAKRSQERQNWLYKIGRRGKKNEKPVTWTLKSKHRDGKAADVMDKKYGYGKVSFYESLSRHAKTRGLQTLKVERCHVQTPF